MTDHGHGSFERLLAFLVRLEQAKIAYRLGHVRESIMIELDVPGEHWEVEFFPDGQIEVERFRSDGVVEGNDSMLERLITQHGSLAPDD